MSRAYDSFDVQLTSLQLLYSKPGTNSIRSIRLISHAYTHSLENSLAELFTDEDWQKARKLRQSSLHILEPVDLKVVFSRAMVVTDSRMPK